MTACVSRWVRVRRRIGVLSEGHLRPGGLAAGAKAVNEPAASTVGSSEIRPALVEAGNPAPVRWPAAPLDLPAVITPGSSTPGRRKQNGVIPAPGSRGG